MQDLYRSKTYTGDLEFHVYGPADNNDSDDDVVSGDYEVVECTETTSSISSTSTTIRSQIDTTASDLASLNVDDGQDGSFLSSKKCPTAAMKDVGQEPKNLTTNPELVDARESQNIDSRKNTANPLTAKGPTELDLDTHKSSPFHNQLHDNNMSVSAGKHSNELDTNTLPPPSPLLPSASVTSSISTSDSSVTIIKVHRIVVCSQCTWFERALSSGMKESIDRLEESSHSLKFLFNPV